MGEAASRWYVVHTQPHAEDRAIENLERQGFTIFCPRYSRTIRHARKAAQYRAALFPSYLFIRLDPARDRWRSVNGSRGVVRLLSQGDVPVPVPDDVVEQLLARMDEHSCIDWSPSYVCGQAVRICDGPFADLIGRIEYLDGAGRVRVLLDLMGRTVSVRTRPDMLSPASH
jgi:transcription elongation factor/antiterminator RfaH